MELRFMSEDKDGNVWFGGRYSILYRYDGNELKDFTQLNKHKATAIAATEIRLAIAA